MVGMVVSWVGLLIASLAESIWLKAFVLESGFCHKLFSFVTGWDKDNCAIKSSKGGGSGRCSPNVTGSSPSAAISDSQTCRAVRTTEYHLLSGLVGKLAQDGKLCIAVPVWYGFVLRQNLV